MNEEKVIISYKDEGFTASMEMLDPDCTEVIRNFINILVGASYSPEVIIRCTNEALEDFCNTLTLNER